MSAQTETNVQTPAQAPKEKKPKLSAKYSKFMEFGYSLVQSLHASGALSDEGLESGYSQLKLFDTVDAQTGFYENVISQSKETGKVMRKFITVRNKPPKAPRARKAPAKKEAVAGEAPKEKKARQPRAKKETPPPPPEVVASEELEEEEISTQEIVINGTTYLIDNSNQLYSIDTHAEMGTYNPETKEISHTC